MLIHILQSLFRNPLMDEDLNGKDWSYFLKHIQKMVDRLEFSIIQSKESGDPLDESISCRLFIWFLTNLFLERLFRNLQMNPNDPDEKLHKTITEIIKRFELHEEDKDSLNSEIDFNPSPKSLKGRTWDERNEWTQLWLNTGKHLLEGKNATNEYAIYREIRFSSYSRILSAWITEIWLYGFSIIEYLAITIHFTSRFFTEDDVIQAISQAQINLGMKDNKLLNDWKFVKFRVKEMLS